MSFAGKKKGIMQVRVRVDCVLTSGVRRRGSSKRAQQEAIDGCGEPPLSLRVPVNLRSKALFDAALGQRNKHAGIASHCSVHFMEASSTVTLLEWWKGCTQVSAAVPSVLQGHHGSLRPAAGGAPLGQKLSGSGQLKEGHVFWETVVTSVARAAQPALLFPLFFCMYDHIFSRRFFSFPCGKRKGRNTAF